jgi:D-aminopeptidase
MKLKVSGIQVPMRANSECIVMHRKDTEVVCFATYHSRTGVAGVSFYHLLVAKAGNAAIQGRAAVEAPFGSAS